MKCQDKLKDTVRLVFTDLNLAILSLRFLLSTLGLSCCYVLFIFSHISTMGGFANVLSEDFISVLYLMDVSIIGMGVNLIIFCVILLYLEKPQNIFGKLKQLNYKIIKKYKIK